jgi:anti-sigma factor (TIGR02949 family)
MSESPCERCERLLQQYLDGELTESEALEAEAHLDECGYCRRRYRFEKLFREYMRRALTSEPMNPALREKLVALRMSNGPHDHRSSRL